MSEASLPAPLPGGSRVGTVLRLALPAVGEQVLNTTVGLVDTYLVGHLGAASIAAVSISNQVVMLAHVLMAAVATGSTVLVARAIGAQDPKTAARTVNQSALLAIVLGIASTVVGVLFARQAVQLMGAADDALPLGTTYLSIVACSFFLSTWMFIGLACLRGAGDTFSTMRVMLLVNVINVVVAASLVYGPFGLPRLGVAGTALGAAAGRSAGSLVVLLLLLRGRAGLQLDWRTLRPDGSIIRRILNVGIPTGLEHLLFRLADMSYFRVITSLGTAACAAHSVALNVQMIGFAPAFGFAVAATTLVGQGMGAGDPRRAEADGYLVFRITVAVAGITALIYSILSRQIIGFFTQEPEVIALGAGPLRLVALAQPFLVAALVFSGALRGAGDTRFPMLYNGVGVFVIRFGLALLFVQILGLGLMGAWYALALDWGMRALFSFLRFRSGIWKKIRV
jgi:MATE family multidrug resistance protein